MPLSHAQRHGGTFFLRSGAHLALPHPLAETERKGVALEAGGAQRQRARNQVERIARTEHNGHPAEERVLHTAFAAADHKDAERDDCAQIGGIK